MKVGVAGLGRIGPFHAATLAGLGHEVVVTDVRGDLARDLAGRHGYAVVPDVDSMLGEVDGVVIATDTRAHAEVLRAALAADVPTFCEKPVAVTLADTIAVTELVEASDVPVQVGFQRRFDEGYRRAKQAVDSGELGFVHSIRSTTHDQSPPAPDYLPTSGGIFRDCNIHDFDIIRYVTGREVASVYAVGANKGEAFFAEAGDVDTGAALLTLDDGTLAAVTSTRYNGAGHDVRMELLGSKAAIGVGYDDSLALTSAESGATYPRGPRLATFLERFAPAYRAEMATFCDVATGSVRSPCSVAEALAAFRIAEAAQRSLESGLPVAVAEVTG
ncbi:MAG: Gfo/Idh/MocA family oxidoreductase [Actinomycetota bacterium]|nr:Gfo/Idh/MocA family oxidoreductase [Actinomycetota bacterium]